MLSLELSAALNLGDTMSRRGAADATC